MCMNDRDGRVHRTSPPKFAVKLLGTCRYVPNQNLQHVPFCRDVPGEKVEWSVGLELNMREGVNPSHLS